MDYELNEEQYFSNHIVNYVWRTQNAKKLKKCVMVGGKSFEVISPDSIKTDEKKL